MYTYCVTGHRPNKLFGYDWNTEENKRLMTAMKELYLENMYEYESVYGDNNFTWIVGGALGIDQMTHQILNEIKEEVNDLNITITLAEPFDGFYGRWSIYDVRRYFSLRDTADKFVRVSELDNYKINCPVNCEKEKWVVSAMLQKRNEYMVDNSNEVIAWWDGTNGGTANCVRYAKSKGKTICQYNPKNLHI